jgi:transcriptional regulator with XRE-family HTH domain
MALTNDTATETGKRILKLIIELGFEKQKDFATLIGIQPATLSAVIKGPSEPSLSIIRAIVDKVENINPFWLINGDGDMFLKKGEKLVILKKIETDDGYKDKYLKLLEKYSEMMENKQTGTKAGLSA